MPALRALRGYRQGYELRALAASSAEKAAAAAQAYDVPLAFGTPAELAACEEVDLVVVSVRLPHHGELVRAALEAGQAVLCEWPLGRDLAEAQALAAGADARGLFTAVGLQARCAPAIRYVTDLVAQGYAGEILSATLVGSGGSWGATIPSAAARYLASPADGATMLSIPFGHTIDAVAAALGEPAVQHATLATRRPMVLDADRGEMVPMTAADQIAVTATLPAGAVLSAHYRGGLSRATNLRWEINGTEGDLVMQAPRGTCRWRCPGCSAGTALTGSWPRWKCQRPITASRPWTATGPGPPTTSPTSTLSCSTTWPPAPGWCPASATPSAATSCWPRSCSAAGQPWSTRGA